MTVPSRRTGATGLVAQGWQQATRLVARLTDGGTTATAQGTHDVVRVKASGMSMVSMGVCGDFDRDDPRYRVLSLKDPVSGRYVEVVVAAGHLVGATCIGDADVAATLSALYTRSLPVPDDPALLLVRALAGGGTASAAKRPDELADDDRVCTCNSVSAGRIRDAVRGGCASVADVAAATRASTGCGDCAGVVGALVAATTPEQQDQHPGEEHVMSEHVVVVGGGMVAHRFVEALRARDTGSAFSVTVLAEEDRAPYDRVGLSAFFAGTAPDELALGAPELWDDPQVGPAHRLRGRRRRPGGTHGRSDRRRWGASPTTTSCWRPGRTPGCPRCPGPTSPGSSSTARSTTWSPCATGCGSARASSAARCVAPSIGGGLLGLEAAGALVGLGAATTVVEFAPRLMALQVDDGGGRGAAPDHRGDGRRRAARARHPSRSTPTREGRVAGLRLADVEAVRCRSTSSSSPPGCGRATSSPLRPGCSTGPRGGVVVDSACVTEDPRVYAIGEVACIEGRCLGLVAPGYAMAEVVVDRLLGGDATFPGADLSTKLKLLGVDVASFGDAFATTPGALELVCSDPVAGVYTKIVVTDDARTLLGGVLVGDASAYASLRPMVGAELGGDPALWLLPESAGARAAADRAAGPGRGLLVQQRHAPVPSATP